MHICIVKIETSEVRAARLEGMIQHVPAKARPPDVCITLVYIICNSYNTDVMDVWYLLHRSTKARSGPRAECNECHAS